MSTAYNIPILIQKKDDETEKWIDYFKAHARINKSGSSEYLQGGAVQSKVSLTFEIRYNKLIKNIRHDTQYFRVVYDDNKFNIVDYDDFMEKHISVKLLGESYE